jgi:hypothetical protein
MKIAKLFILSAGILLLATAIAKLISAGGSALVLEVPDPILLISFRHLLLVVGACELLIALFCIFGHRIIAQACLVAWLATNFLVYRVAFILNGDRRPCPCLGTLTEAIHVPQRTAEIVMRVVLAYLLIGSYAALFWLWWQRKKQSFAASASAQ